MSKQQQYLQLASSSVVLRSVLGAQQEAFNPLTFIVQRGQTGGTLIVRAALV